MHLHGEGDHKPDHVGEAALKEVGHEWIHERHGDQEVFGVDEEWHHHWVNPEEAARAVHEACELNGTSKDPIDCEDLVFDGA